jgi:hypothetical protein
MNAKKSFLAIRFFPVFLLIMLTLETLSAQQNRGISCVEVIKTYTQEVLGTNVGFYVEIRNNCDTAFDAIEYTVYYYDGFGEKMGEKKFKWQSGNLIKSIETGKVLKDYRANWIKGANKIKVVVTRVHFADEKNNNTRDV